MSLDITALAKGGWTIAKRVAASVMSDATVYVGNTPTVDPSNDTATPTWAHTVNLTKAALFYGRKLVDEQDAAEETRGATARVTEAKIVIGVADMGGVTPDTDSQVAIAGETWSVYEVSTPPGGAIYLLTVRK